MFNEETVLILGAGASAHAGFPLGSQLIRNIEIALWNGTTIVNNKKERLYDHLLYRDFFDALDFQQFDLCTRQKLVNFSTST